MPSDDGQNGHNMLQMTNECIVFKELCFLRQNTNIKKYFGVFVILLAIPRFTLSSKPYVSKEYKKVTQNHVHYQHTKAFYHTIAPHTTQNSMWHPQNVTGKQIIPYNKILTLVSGKPRCRILKETTDPF